jgi:hypothetical protein
VSPFSSLYLPNSGPERRQDPLPTLVEAARNPIDLSWQVGIHLESWATNKPMASRIRSDRVQPSISTSTSILGPQPEVVLDPVRYDELRG